jgi:hypothetical protein
VLLNDHRPHVVLSLAGTVLVLVTSVLGSGFNLLAIPFAAWSLVPYAALFLAGRATANPWLVIGAGIAALATEIGVRLSVFAWPRGSTAAVALVFSPVYILAMAMPAGAVVGWLFGLAWRRHAIGRLIVIVLGPAMAGLIVLGFARPELFPTNVVRRRELLARVGPPRVVVGADTVESTVVSDQPQWSFAAEIDGVPGDELALVDHQGARVVDPDTLQTRRTLTFPERPAGFWDSFATLVRLDDGEVVIAQTGGGFSRTLVRRLDGSTLWDYHPHPKLPPDSLDPADLDGDGRVEFYAASAEAIARLDTAGREMWRQPAKLADLAALLPRADGHPAWVVGVEYGVRAIVCSDSGEMLGTLPLREGGMTTAADYAGERLLIVAADTVRGFALSGTLRVEIPLGDFTASQVLGIRLAPGAPSSLVIVGATDRDASRWRLLIVDGDRRVVYDEITDAYPRVFVARGASGRDALFVSTGGVLRRLLVRQGKLPA